MFLYTDYGMWSAPFNQEMDECKRMQRDATGHEHDMQTNIRKYTWELSKRSLTGAFICHMLYNLIGR